MKTTTRPILSFLLLSLTACFAFGGAVPPIEVMISNAGGKQVFKGTTNAKGEFATDAMPGGNYVVQFNSKSPGVKGAKFGLAVTAGKNQMTADSVTGGKLADPGVAMRIAVAGSSRITGQVSSGGRPAANKSTAAAKTNSEGTSDQRVKIINGKRYVWKLKVSSDFSSGEWVEESEAQKNSSNGPVISQTPRRSGSRY